jgi:hypothetical protein
VVFASPTLPRYVAISVRRRMVLLIKPHLEGSGSHVEQGLVQSSREGWLEPSVLEQTEVANPQRQTGMGVRRWGERRVWSRLDSKMEQWALLRCTSNR